ncbi:hypothetical protein WSK_2591 [Novosphingobium sp. Rr 2-17]|uniref:DUF6265 family protein n=1 Tax=Novosphingobium sp. Rr 2-17 TaxID=555793 RepID=UPI0002698216|nr:DUF6265 family protein [Novosphingobium sp. Rr 2-17]EIZ78546.1 hypothetical protein WSK_2591 [Novosphingobium sp. Rr 2-17]
MIRMLCLLLLAATPAAAQETRSLSAGGTSPRAAIDQLGWLVGSWTGEAMGDRVAETYSAPLGGRIVGHFVAGDGKGGVSFTELVEYVPLNGSIAYRVRHFGPDMKGWEDKIGVPVVFPLVAVEGARWYFDGMTIDRTGPDALTMWVRIGDGAKANEVPFRLKRAEGSAKP